MSKNNNLRNKLRIQLHAILALILLLHAAFYLVYWFAIGDLRGEVDRFIEAFTGFDIPYTTILIFLTIGIGVWSLIRFAGMRLAARKAAWNPSKFNWIYFGVWSVFLGLFYYSFLLILRENPSQKGVLYQLINLVRLGTDPFLFLIAATWLRRTILSFRVRAMKEKTHMLWGIGIGFVLILLVGFWLLPAIFPPNWAYQGDLPAKPALIAHRGASMLAPENTLAAGELAAEFDAFGFETDVRISKDGVPFLMHDQTLQRTTNISEVYPERANDDASSFTIDELRALNAGLWFIQKDPFDTINSGLISQAQLSLNQGQKIPTLAQALTMVDEEKLVILFDLRYPPQEHPYHDRFFEIVFDLCKEFGLNGDVWFLVGQDNLDIVLEEAPQMTRVIGVSSTDLPDPDELIELNYEIVNVDTGIIKDEIRAYRLEGLGVNVYTIDQPWLFSQFWLSGVTSVTTNNIHTFSQLNAPILNLPYSRFLLFWGLFGIIVAIWIASSQPKINIDRKSSGKVETPNLMDFAMEEDSQTKEQVSSDTDLEEGRGTAIDAKGTTLLGRSPNDGEVENYG
jgi:glycerophosphoryl diester phosphodiesterase